MNKPFKFRYVNEIVGAFVLLVVFLLVAAVIITGRAQGWFEPTLEVHVEFPEEGSLGLRRGSEVRVLDTPAGMVLDIEPREDGVMEAVLQVRGRFAQFIRDDSTGMVKRAFGVAGDAYVEITRGRGGPLPAVRPYIPLVKDTELLDLAESLLEEVRATTVPAIEQLQLLLEEYTALAQDLRDPEGAVQESVASLNRTLQGLETALAETTEKVNRILADVAEASAHLPRMTQQVAGELEDVPGLVYQTQATLQEAEVLIEGIQRHWLIRRHIEKEGRPTNERIAPSVLAGAGEGGL